MINFSSNHAIKKTALFDSRQQDEFLKETFDANLFVIMKDGF